MRNNEERLGTKDDQSSPSTLSPLEFVSPTSFVKLPSEGLYYPEGHPLYNQETIEVKEMTAKEEDILTSRALLEQGVVIERLMESLVVDKTIKVNSLLSGDRNAIMVQARISAYGPSYKVGINCPACGEQNKHEFNLDEIEAAKTELHELVERLPNNNIMVKLSNGWEVECKMLDGSDEKRMLKESERKKKNKIPETPLTDMLKLIVVSISGHKDRKTINEAISFMPAKDTRLLREAYQTAVPSMDMSQVFECRQCGHNEDMEIPLSAEFFWPK